MTPENFAHNIKVYQHDQYEIVKPRHEWRDSGNGILYSAYFVLLYRLLGGAYSAEQAEWFSRITKKCFYRPGILMRTPDNTYGQEQFDNYWGFAVAAHFLKLTELAKLVLHTAVKNKFMMDTDGKKEGKDFLGRYPLLWFLMFCSAYPKLKWLMFLPLTVGSFFMKPKAQDASGNNLQFAYMAMYFDLFRVKFIYNRWKKNADMGESYANYFGKNSFFHKAMVACEQKLP